MSGVVDAAVAGSAGSIETPAVRYLGCCRRLASAQLCTMDAMGETRQQRRARERAAAKAARGPGANLPPLEIVVELFRYTDEDDDGPYA